MVADSVAEEMCKCFPQGVGAFLNQAKALHHILKANAFRIRNCTYLRHKKPSCPENAGIIRSRSPEQRSRMPEMQPSIVLSAVGRNKSPVEIRSVDRATD